MPTNKCIIEYTNLYPLLLASLVFFASSSLVVSAEEEQISFQAYRINAYPGVTKSDTPAHPKVEEEIIGSVSSESIDLNKIYYENPYQTVGKDCVALAIPDRAACEMSNKFPPIKLEASLTDPISISLEDALAQAIENNINLNISKQDSIVAKWDFWQQFSTLLPDFEYKLQGSDFDGAIFITPNLQNPVDQTQVRSNFRINYRAFSGGTNSFLTWAERNYSKAMKESERLQYNQTLLDTVTLYNDLLKEQVSLANRLKAVEEASFDVDTAEKFLRAGQGTKYDLYQAQARLARAQEQLIEKQASFREAEITLSEHLNLPLESPLQVQEAELKKFNLIPKELDIAEFIDTAEENNPRIKRALLNKKGAYKEAISKIGTFLPKVDLFADFGGTGEDLGNLTGLDTLGFVMTIDAGKGTGLSPVSEILRSRANAKKAKLEYEKEKQSIEKDLRLAFLNFEKAKALIQAAAQEVKSTVEGLRLSRLRYQNGIGVMNEVVTRQRELSDAEITLADSLAEFNNAQARMAFEMGSISIESLLAK